MSSSDDKRSGGPGSLFAFLFTPEQRAQANEEYQRALAEEQERQAKKPESEERKEGEPRKCWIN
jgi:hypothetical protein